MILNVTTASGSAIALQSTCTRRPAVLPAMKALGVITRRSSLPCSLLRFMYSLITWSRSSVPVARRAVVLVGRASSVTCAGIGAAGLAGVGSGRRGEPSIEVVRMAGGLACGWLCTRGGGCPCDDGRLPLTRFGCVPLGRFGLAALDSLASSWLGAGGSASLKDDWLA